MSHLYPQLPVAGDVIALLPSGYCARRRVDIVELLDGLLAAPAGGLAFHADDPDLDFLVNEAVRRSRGVLPLGLAGREAAGAPFSFGLDLAAPLPANKVYVALQDRVAPAARYLLLAAEEALGPVAAGDGSGQGLPWPPLPASVAGLLVTAPLFPDPYEGLGSLISRVRRLRTAWLGRHRVKS